MSDIDADAATGVCAACGPVSLKRKTNSSTGARWSCRNAERKWNQNARQRGYWRHDKGTTCNRCGFVAVDPSQLDVHHRDGNHHNNETANLETICANCHRLEHFGRKAA